MRFEWDERKNNINLGKHELAFEDAAEIIINPIKVVYESAHSGTDRKRYVAVGKLKGKYHSVIYTLRDNGVVRIISARRARDGEKRQYGALFDN